MPLALGIEWAALQSGGFVGTLFPPPDVKNPPLSLLILQPPPEADEEEEEEPEPEEPPVTGQIVETVKPKEEVRPEEAEYLAEHDQTVEEETRSERYKINPEVLSDVFSREEKMEQEDLVDMNVTEESTGATVGNDHFEPDRDGRLSALPSPWTATNKDGLQAPVPASHRAENMAGAPNNDLVDEKRGDRLALNTKEFLYASYLNRIRRLVNFYWDQNLDNLPRSVRLSKPRYTTAVQAVLDADGSLEIIELMTLSGSPELDDCVVRAFQVAGPFPHPPEGLIEKDGRVYLPDMSFTVVLGQAQNHYQGVDPRAGVQFPGIMKSPH